MRRRSAVEPEPTDDLSDDLLASIFNASPVAIILSRVADGMILRANPASLEMLGWQQDELVGQSADALRLWVNPEGRALMVETLLSEGRITGLEIEIRTKGGQT